MTSLIDAKLCINRVKILVVGDKGVGKTTLIRAFKNEKFIDFGAGTNETIYKVEYIGEKRVLFQMVELDVGSRFPPESQDSEAILLLFDNEEEQTRRRVRDYWYSKINLHFSHLPIFLIRTKYDLKNINNPSLGYDLKQSIHAVKYFECSAKQVNGVKSVFLEILSTVKKEKNKLAMRGEHRKCDDANPITSVGDTSTYSIGCTMGAVGNSGPLIKQAVANLRECITNPAAFSNYKRSITYYLPFIDFGLQPENINNMHTTNDSENMVPNSEQK